MLYHTCETTKRDKVACKAFVVIHDKDLNPDRNKCRRFSYNDCTHSDNLPWQSQLKVIVISTDFFMICMETVTNTVYTGS